MRSAWPPLVRLSVASAGVVTYPAGATFGPRPVHDFEFVWIIEGGGTIRYDEHTIRAVPGTILLCRPRMKDRYDWGEKEKSLHAFFHFQCELPKRGWPSPSTWPLSQMMPPDDVLRPLFRYVLGADSLSEPLRSSLLLPCVDFMLRGFISGKLTIASDPHAKLTPPVEMTLQRICDMTSQETAPPITLAQLARAAHVSPEHLCRLFRESLDLTPLECVRLARLERAATLLRRSDLPIKQVADSAGFPDAFYFSTAFQKAYKLSPRAYRKATREAKAVFTNPIVRFILPRIPKNAP
jgi:AraC-like DNA-binding protein